MNHPFKRVNEFSILAILLGFTTIVTQIIYLREFLLVFGGNELIIGIILAVWMIITGLGAFFGKYMKSSMLNRNLIVVLIGILSLLPVLTLFMINFLRSKILLPGLATDINMILISVPVILLPFCLISGFVFTYLSSAYSTSRQVKLIDKIYAFETLGSIIGGLLFTFIFSSFFSTLQILGFVFFLNSIVMLLFIKLSVIVRMMNIFLPILYLYFTFSYDLDKHMRQYLFQNQELILTKDTPYGNLSVTRSGDDINVYENNTLIYSPQDVMEIEESVHMAMVQRDRIRNVLLISGGVSGTIQEILKYPVEGIDYVEINPWVIRIGEMYTTSLKSEKIRTIKEDIRHFIKKTEEHYDVIFINAPEPHTAQINRFYTSEFYEELKTILVPGGIIAFGLNSASSYINDEAIKLNSCIYNTVKSSFHHVHLFPGNKIYFIASDMPLYTNVTERIDIKNIKNQYFNKYYVSDTLMQVRSSDILSSVNPSTSINSDFYPVAYLNQITYWLSRFDIKLRYLIALVSAVFILLLAILFRSNPVNGGIFITGFTGASIEYLFILIYQILYGYIYKTIGIFFAVFMAGLALGSYFRKKILNSPEPVHFIYLQSALAFAASASAFILPFLHSHFEYSLLIALTIYSILFFISFLTGTCFSLATVLRKDGISDTAGGIYSSDLSGSAFGLFLTSLLIIPLAGIKSSLLIIGGIGFFSVLIMIFYNRRNRLRNMLL